MSLQQRLVDSSDQAAPADAAPHPEDQPTAASPNNFLPPYVTTRANILGIFSAFVNSFVNMVFNFRSGGGLSTFWITVVCYALFKYLDKRFPIGHLLHPHNFTPQEHGYVVLMASAAAFSQSLGLSSGLAVLELDYGQTFGFGQLLVWTTAAGFFGLFLGMLYARALVVETTLPWPSAQVVSDTIFAFHGQMEELEASYSRGKPSQHPAPPREDSVDIDAVAAVSLGSINGHEEVKMLPHAHDMHAPTAADAAVDGEKLCDIGSDAEASKALKMFSIFAALAFASYLLDQVFVPWIYTFPILCWVCRRCGSWSQIMGEFYIGLGFPGLGFDFSSSMGFVIVPLSVLFW